MWEVTSGASRAGRECLQPWAGFCDSSCACEPRRAAPHRPPSRPPRRLDKLPGHPHPPQICRPASNIALHWLSITERRITFEQGDKLGREVDIQGTARPGQDIDQTRAISAAESYNQGSCEMRKDYSVCLWARLDPCALQAIESHACRTTGHVSLATNACSMWS